MIAGTGKETGISIYASLADRIRGLIRKGEYTAGQMIGSEHELARQESISRMTVRKASELLINEGLLERRPGKGLYVRGSCGMGNGVVQLVVGSLLWDTSVQMTRGVQAAAKDDGVHVQIYDAHGDIGLDLALIDQLPSSGARGAVIVSLHHPLFSQAICRLQAAEFPFVLLDQRMRDIAVSSVTSDSMSGGYQVGRLLAQSGHKRIAFIGDLMAATVQERLTGLRDAMGDANLPFKSSMVVDLNVGGDRFGDWSACISSGARRLMELDAPPTAIFCSCDAIARQLYRDLRSMGLAVPQDVSVVGYDDDPLADYLTPRLTTVRQPFGAMGQAAMELLRKRIISPSEAVETRVLPVELVVRESVAAPSRA